MGINRNHVIDSLDLHAVAREIEEPHLGPPQVPVESVNGLHHLSLVCIDSFNH